MSSNDNNDNDKKPKFDYREQLLNDIPPELLPKDGEKKAHPFDPRTLSIRELMDSLGVFRDLIKVIPNKEAAAQLEKYFDNEIEAHDKLLDQLRGYMDDPEYRKKMILALASRQLGK